MAFSEGTTKLYVSNLPDNSDRLKLQAIFQPFGEVKECDVVRNNAYVHMFSEDEAKVAARDLHNTHFEGNNISVKVARIRPITLNDIYLLKELDGRELLRKLNTSEFGFSKFLQDNRYIQSDHETFDGLIEVIAKACSVENRECGGGVRKLLKSIVPCEEFLYEEILKVMNEYLDSKDKALPDLVKRYLVILKAITKNRMKPDDKIRDYVFPTLQNILNTMKRSRYHELDEIEKEYALLKRIVERNQAQSLLIDDDDDDTELFRQMSIFPTGEDVVNVVSKNPPVNKVDEAYNSVSQYLSTHFRLMREDMLRSLREGINIYNSNPDEAYKFGVQTYEHVKAVFPPKYNILGVVYKLNIKTSQPVEWTKKAVLMPGNIVCLTPDRFHTIHFATVKGDPKAKSGTSTEATIEVVLENDTRDVLHTDVEYFMFEPTAYFECYKHVLTAIRDFDRNTLPLSDILVFFYYDNSLPEYLLNREKYRYYSLPIETDSDNVEAQGDDVAIKKFDPVRLEEWPTAKELKLDDQQHAAFQLALTKKVAVIQGPPGTGKSFIGVKVVKALLENISLTPIVIACLTNQAVDQFMEAILRFNKNIVRIGSQSKSRALEPYTLDNLIYALKDYHSKKETTYTGYESNTLKKSKEFLKNNVPIMLERMPSSDMDTETNTLRCISRNLSEDFKLLSLCLSKYLDDNALNAFIPSKQKEDLQKFHERPDAMRRKLSMCVLEWLCESRESSLYSVCEKWFMAIPKEKSTKGRKKFFEIRDIWSLNLNQRFEYFHFWREECISLLRKNIERDQLHYEKAKLQCRRSVDPIKLGILQSAKVIGVTTTGACKYRDLLKQTQAVILIVEEAAEVLEAHILASLLPTTQHLIMIGDHKQLRPLPSCHELAEKYHLNVSMFERLFNNYCPSETLIYQHRMKPSIAELLVNEQLYINLQSFENVFSYEEIRGVKSSLFFLNHKNVEDDQSSSTSASNKYEAEMVVNLAKYFCKLGYNSEDITILATYAAQVNCIQNYLTEEVFVTTVDNYQGKENDIVIVSFVRNNSKGLIGFLKENNRVCVALSRAKKGMFCLGNFTLYAEKSDLWEFVVGKLKEKDMIGDTFPLMCYKHKTECSISRPEEVLAFEREGCKEKCGFLLLCSHFCQRNCHYDDPDHSKYLCTMPCDKLISETKKCSRRCFEKCKRSKRETVLLDCGHEGRYDQNSAIIEVCKEEVEKLLPCEHFVKVPCCTDAASYKCPAVVSVCLPCGHSKRVSCHRSKDHDVFCTEPKDVKGPCLHRISVPCNLDLAPHELLAFCQNACDELLACGHPCVGTCNICKDFGIHAFCRERCIKVLSCGHRCGGWCGIPCPPCEEKCAVICKAHNHHCVNKCSRICVHCVKSCERACTHGRCTARCYEPCTIKPCIQPCNEVLPCNHPCIGFCGDSCPHICRVCHKEDLDGPDGHRYVSLLDCEHVVEAELLARHIDECLDSFEWPSCPKCRAPIFNSLRYKEQILQAKENVIACNDNSVEMEGVRYLLENMFGVDGIIPHQFADVHRKIEEILNDKPASGKLHILSHCVQSLTELVSISKKLSGDHDDHSKLVFRFENLLLWICNHLTVASYQQLSELEKSVACLKKAVFG